MPAAYASILPLTLGTIAMFDAIHPSAAFSVDTTGWPWLSGQSGRELRLGDGTTVALKTNACAVPGTPHGPSTTSTGGESVPLNGRPLPILRVSKTRQGTFGYSDRPPVPGAAK